MQKMQKETILKEEQGEQKRMNVSISPRPACSYMHGPNLKSTR